MPKRHSPLQSEMVQGTLDMLILQTLVLGAAHGQTIAHAIERGSEEVLQVEHGVALPGLAPAAEPGWIAAFWGTSENNRKAKYYRLTPAGKRNSPPDIPLGTVSARDRSHPESGYGEAGMNWRRFFHRGETDAEQRAGARLLYRRSPRKSTSSVEWIRPRPGQRHRRKLGNTTLIREEVYRMNTFTFLEGALRDALHALR